MGMKIIIRRKRIMGRIMRSGVVVDILRPGIRTVPKSTSQQPRAVPPRQNKTPVPLYGDHGNDLENVDYDSIKVTVLTCTVITMRCCGSFEGVWRWKVQGDWRVLDPGA